MSDDPTAGLPDVEDRLTGMAGADEAVLAYAATSVTDDGAYYLVARHYPHPDPKVGDATIFSLRYAYLTRHRGDGSDGWLDNGINIRIEGDPGEFLEGLAQLIAASRARLGSDRSPATDDLRE